ncbi:hypothetical protein Asera_57570 [Actinocatenispora sera]|uniref:Uncharacterized protein n=1 Tax=Actinocatenispora sera TaxID=390989 RepID=A0A810L8U6_9ACTN|nr:hypothetical protein Asera_57570 [Actinocatenispora sera]
MPLLRSTSSANWSHVSTSSDAAQDRAGQVGADEPGTTKIGVDEPRPVQIVRLPEARHGCSFAGWGRRHQARDIGRKQRSYGMGPAPAAPPHRAGQPWGSASPGGGSGTPRRTGRAEVEDGGQIAGLARTGGSPRRSPGTGRLA